MGGRGKGSANDGVVGEGMKRFLMEQERLVDKPKSSERAPAMLTQPTPFTQFHPQCGMSGEDTEAAFQ